MLETCMRQSRNAYRRWNVLSLSLFATFPARQSQRSQNIGHKAPNGHTIDDGDRFGECYYAILRHGWGGRMLLDVP